SPSQSLKIQGDDIQGALDAQEKELLRNAKPLAPLDNIHEEMRIIRFFIKYHFRDAAYLMVDNVKKTLATLPHATPKDQETVEALSRELDDLESDLRKTMPFTL